VTEWGEAGDPGRETVLETGGLVDLETGSNPTWFLLAAGVAAAVGALALAGGIALNFFGYAASSLAVFTLVAFFRRGSLRRAAALGISPPRNPNFLALALLAAGFVLSLVHAWLIASYLS
jgi:hypothetical protein